MSKSLIVVIVTVAFLSLCPSSTVTAEEGWKFPSLNPFQSETSRSPARTTNNSSWWGTPKLPGFSSTPARRPGPQKPSMLTKMTRGTKNAMSKTYDALTPWDNNKPKKPATNMNYSNSKSDSSGGFFGWFSPKEEPEIRTVNDFLIQPRP